MNPAVRKLALFTRDLLQYDEQLIRIGRQNFTRKQFEQPFIVVDNIAPAVRSSGGERYDGDAEEQTLSAIYKAPCTLTFYGDGAHTRALDFTLRARSEKARQLRRSLGVGIYATSNVTDVKQVTGQQYGERVEVELTVQYTESITLDVLRIDEAQLELSTEDRLK